MVRACVLLAPGFEEIEAVTIVDVLRRAGVDAFMVGLSRSDVTGAHDVTVVADAILADVGDEKWDAVVLPGGMPGAENLRDNQAVQRLVREQHGAGRWVAAICAAPIALAKAGILKDVRATCYPGFEGQLDGARLQTDAVVVDENVITSRGPGTALKFALSLAAELMGPEAADKVAEGLLTER